MEQDAKNKIRKIFRFILVILWMVVVFCFSAQGGEKSSITSNTATKQIINVLPSTKHLAEPQKTAVVAKVNPVLRKIAHYTMYILGGILIFGWLRTYAIALRTNAMYTTILGMLYATSDEIHQLFSGGRSAQLSDVCLDTLGVITGLLLYIAMIKLKDTITQKRRKKIE